MDMSVNEVNIRSLMEMQRVSKNYPIGSIVGFYVNDFIRFGKVVDYSYDPGNKLLIDVKEFGEESSYRRIDPYDQVMNLFKV